MHFFQQLVSCAQRSLDRARVYQKKHADKRRRELTFNVGDRVMLSTTHLETTLPSAFRRRYVGPFAVTQRISDVAYRLELPPNMRIHNVFHVSLLKPYHGSPDRFASVREPVPPADDDDDAIDSFLPVPEVDKILARRERVVPNGGVAVEVLVHWRDTPDKR